jgi:hypothetical protein
MQQNNITQVYWKNLPELLSPEGKPSQSLKNFDSEFVDIVDYIIRITHRIWEQKNIALCNDYYSEYCPVHTLGGYSDDVATVIKNTLLTLAAFPDRSLIGENVVWRDLGEDNGYYSSHRITSIMTNKNSSEFGAATGKTGRVTTIADCVCYENKIVYEWLMRDNSFLVKQLGISLVDAATHFANQPTNEKFEIWREQEIKRIKAGKALSNQWHTPLDENSEKFAHLWVSTFFNKKAFSEIKDFYHTNAKLQWPGGIEAVGVPGIRGVFIQWLAQSPDATATCDHISVVPFEEHATDIAIRWSVAGTFAPKNELFSKYQGQNFFVLGATHLRIINGKISQEWTVFDEVAAYANVIRDYNNSNTAQGV